MSCYFAKSIALLFWSFVRLCHLVWLVMAFFFARPLNLAAACIFHYDLELPTVRLPAILVDLINRACRQPNSIYAEVVQWLSTRPWRITILVNSKHEWRKWPLKSISICLLVPFCLPSYSVPENSNIIKVLLTNELIHGTLWHTVWIQPIVLSR